MSITNTFNLIGRLGQDAAVRTNQAGTSFLSLRVAVDRNVKGQDGTWTKQTTWLDVIKNAGQTPDKQAAIFTKGTLVAVQGEIRTREITLADGKKISVPFLRADSVEKLASASGTGSSQGSRAPNPQNRRQADQQARQPQATPLQDGFGADNGDVPF